MSKVTEKGAYQMPDICPWQMCHNVRRGVKCIPPCTSVHIEHLPLSWLKRSLKGAHQQNVRVHNPSTTSMITMINDRLMTSMVMTSNDNDGKGDQRKDDRHDIPSEHLGTETAPECKGLYHKNRKGFPLFFEALDFKVASDFCHCETQSQPLAIAAAAAHSGSEHINPIQ